MTTTRELLRRRHWIFDLDGTLTVAVHDFEAIREQLGLPPGRPILEQLAERPADERAVLAAELAAIEQDIARGARPAEGAAELLDRLSAQGHPLGILTRNTHANAMITLAASGLERWFAPEHVLGRDEAAPKPSPEGVRVHLRRWRADPADAVMVGDFAFDLQAGRAAGVATLYLDPSGVFPHAEWADVCLESFAQLRSGPNDPAPPGWPHDR